ncbi:MAG: NIL domain-containing protein [Bacteroidales bacterium]
MNKSTQGKYKRRLVLKFPAETVDQPITYNLIKEYDVEINILNADITSGKEGKLLMEMKGSPENLDEATVYLESCRIEITPAIKTILFREEECIHCGACSSVCFPGALNMEASSRMLVFDPEKCVACELCIRACPLGLFELNFGLS